MQAHLEPYLSWQLDQGKSKKSILVWRQKVRHFLEWLAGREVTLRLLYEYRDYLQKDKIKPHRADRGCRPRTVRAAFSALRGFFRYLESQGRKDLPDVAAVAMPRLDTAVRAVPSSEEVRALFAAAEHAGAHARCPLYRSYLRLRALAVLSLAAGCGLRRAEILALDVTDLRTDRTPWEVNVRFGKGAQARWVPIGETEQGHLEAWLRTRDGRCQRLDHRTPALLVDDKGRRLGNHGIEGIVETLKGLAGLDETALTLHGLRHAFGAYLLRAKGPKTTQVLMGHASVSTTLEVYGHTDADQMREAVADLSRSIHTPDGQAGSDSPRRGQSRRRAPGGRGRRGYRV